MDDAVNKVLADYHTRAAREAELMNSTEPHKIAAILDDLLLPVGPETGTVLNLLARGMAAQTIVELGTSYGYSTVYLAEAARATGGKVITFELAER
jgi:predicted O-methyltransferase YrrM